MLKYVVLNLNIGFYLFRLEGIFRFVVVILDFDERFIYKGKVSINMYIKDLIVKRL